VCVRGLVTVLSTLVLAVIVDRRTAVRSSVDGQTPVETGMTACGRNTDHAVYDVSMIFRSIGACAREAIVDWKVLGDIRAAINHQMSTRGLSPQGSSVTVADPDENLMSKFDGGVFVLKKRNS